MVERSRMAFGHGGTVQNGFRTWWNGPEWLSDDVILETQTYEIDDEIRNAVINKEKGSDILHDIGMVADENSK